MTNFLSGLLLPTTKENSSHLTLNTCLNCNSRYEVGKSTSSLRLQYCEIFCEIRHLGFSLEALEKGVLSPKSAATIEKTEPVAVKSVPVRTKKVDDDDERDLVPA